MQVYLNGRYVDHASASIHVDDRGFLLADGVYEVIRVYDGKPLLARQHIDRLREGLAALRIRDAGIDDLDAIIQRLVAANDIGADGTFYLQVTRGVAPRRHAFPAPHVKPTVYAVAKPFKQHPAAYFSEGVDAITTPDIRWSRCDIKSIALLPNVLANQAAHDADAFEAVFVRDGVLLEGSHSNVFAVVDGELLTAPSDNFILTGITRTLTVELAHELGIPMREAPIRVDRRRDISEMFLTGTTTEIMPVARLDGANVGAGRRGPITARLQEAFHARVGELIR